MPIRNTSRETINSANCRIGRIGPVAAISSNALDISKRGSLSFSLDCGGTSVFDGVRATRKRTFDVLVVVERNMRARIALQVNQGVGDSEAGKLSVARDGTNSRPPSTDCSERVTACYRSTTLSTPAADSQIVDPATTPRPRDSTKGNGPALIRGAFLTLEFAASAGVVQWQNGSFPSCIRGFDSLHPLHPASGAGLREQRDDLQQAIGKDGLGEIRGRAELRGAVGNVLHRGKKNNGNVPGTVV